MVFTLASRGYRTGYRWRRRRTLDDLFAVRQPANSRGSPSLASLSLSPTSFLSPTTPPPYVSLLRPVEIILTHVPSQSTTARPPFHHLTPPTKLARMAPLAGSGHACRTLVEVDPFKPAKGQAGLMNRWHPDIPAIATVAQGEVSPLVLPRSNVELTRCGG